MNQIFFFDFLLIVWGNFFFFYFPLYANSFFLAYSNQDIKKKSHVFPEGQMVDPKAYRK